MISHGPHVMTLANSIIGVSVLAMPFCFKQCGIILAIIVLLLCSLLSRLSCHFLIKSAVMSRRRNFEYLAFHAFGQMGKFIIELFIIGFLLGTCIAFFVVIGDLGPQIIGKLLNKNPEDIRLSFMLVSAIFIILPLGMLKNIDSLAIVCTATIGFYLCLVLKVVSDSTDSIFQEDWQKNVNYWRSAGLLQCLPIFSMALFCQTQLFEIYESIPNVSLEKMNIVVRGALNICTFVYLFVGFFGYVAYSNQPFSGNILSSFEPSATADAMKIGFVLSVIFSFPLVIFPCRASLNSLLFQQIHSHDLTSNYIPESRFRYLTVAIVAAAMTTGMVMPNIEFVLGFVGSTIGVSICVICPAAFFIAISTKNTNERLLAQVLLFIGIWIMILGTYANLYAMDDSSTTKVPVHVERLPLIQINNEQFNRDFLPIVPGDHHELDLNVGKILEKKINDLEIPDLVDKHLVMVTKAAVKLVPPAKIDDKPEENEEKHVENVVDENKIIEKTSEVIEILNAEEKIKAIEESMKQEPQELVQVDDKIVEEVAAPGEAKNVKEEETEPVDKESIRLTLERNKIETKKLIEEQKEILQEQKEFLEDLKEQKKALEMDKELLSQDGKEEKKKIEMNKAADLGNEGEKKKINIDEDRMELDKQNKVEKETVDRTKEKLIPQVDKDLDRKVKLVSVEEIKLSNGEKNNSSDSEKKKSIQQVKDENKSQGSILQILTNKTAVKNESLNTEKHIKPLDAAVLVNLIDKKMNSTIIINEKLDEKNSSKQIPYPLPLALKIINETRHKESQKIEINNEKTQDNNNNNNNNNNDNKNSGEKQSLNQRDILAVHERDKRDVDEEDFENSSIIKTNNHLTDPRIGLNSKIPEPSIVNVNYGNLQIRDLKALNSDNRRD